MELVARRARSSRAPAAARAPSAALDPESSTPLYHQLYVLLRNRVLGNALVAGDVLPGEQELASLHGVSRVTAKRALDELAADGLVVRERGRGTRVLPRGPDGSVTASVDGWLESVAAMGRATVARVLELDYREPSAEVARALELEPGARIQHAVRVRLLDGEPMSYLVTCVPESVGRGYSREQLEDVTLLALLERGGVDVASALQSISATLAESDVAAALDTPVGGPLLEVRRVVRDADARPVEYLRALYRPDRYRLQMSMRRVDAAGERRWRANDADPAAGRAPPTGPASDDRPPTPRAAPDAAAPATDHDRGTTR